MKQAKIQICLFIVLLAGLTGCGSVSYTHLRAHET